jgi:large subunit ribosomal protein L21
VPNSTGSLTAVVVSGGKQYRVASGDRILVDRLAAEPGSELSLERVLMVVEGDSVKLSPEALAGQVVRARVVAHRRGPKIDVLRYRPKKRVRVHRGARAELTALEILSIGSAGQEKTARPGGSRPRSRAARKDETDAVEPAETVAPETVSEATETDLDAPATPQAADSKAADEAKEG